MQKINKILLTSIISFWCFISFSFGTDNSDCGIFAIWNYNNNWDSDNSFQIVENVRWNDDYIYSKFLDKNTKIQIMDKNDLNTAILNLKKYCCEKELWWLSSESKTCKDDKNFFNLNSLDSQYLYDHLFDVIMRRLNWLTWDNDIYTRTKMTTDELWTERRERISEKAEDLSWSDVQSIVDKYKKFREYHLKYDITSQINAQFWNASNEDFLRYTAWLWGEESEKIAKALKNYKDWSLYDRYHNACALTQYFYWLLNVWIQSDDKIKTINKLAKWTCDDIVKEQIANENKYVWLVTQRAGNRFLYNFVEGYISYLYERRNTLKKTQKDANNKRLDVVRAVPHLVKSCVK